MRKPLTAFLVVALCVLLVPGFQQSAQASEPTAYKAAVSRIKDTSPDYLQVKNYSINAILNDEKDRLTMTVTAKVKNNTKKSFSYLYFRNPAATMISRAESDFWGNSGCKSKIVSARNIATKRELHFTCGMKNRDIVKVKLGKDRLKPGGTITIRISSKADIPWADARFGCSASADGQGLFYYLSLCYPQLADYRAGTWSLSPFPKQGENRLARATSYDVTFKAPKEYKVAATGSSKTRKGTTKVKARNVRDFALVACDFMKKDIAKVGGVKIVNWYLPGVHAAKYRKESMLAVKDAVSYLTAHVGRSPFNEIDVVQAFGGEGNVGCADMEHSALVTIAGDWYYYNWGPINVADGALSRTAYHEIAHQWFYAAVGNDEYNEPWLDEGMAAYYNKWAMWKGVTATSCHLAQASGMSAEEYITKKRESFRSAVRSAETRTGVTKLNGSVSSYDDYFSTVYSTSVWFLIQLEEEVGEQTFDTIMKDYYRSYRLKEATTQGFLKIVRSHADNPSVEALIARYFPK